MAPSDSLPPARIVNRRRWPTAATTAIRRRRCCRCGAAAVLPRSVVRGSCRVTRAVLRWWCRVPGCAGLAACGGAGNAVSIIRHIRTPPANATCERRLKTSHANAVCKVACKRREQTSRAKRATCKRHLQASPENVACSRHQRTHQQSPPVINTCQSSCLHICAVEGTTSEAVSIEPVLSSWVRVWLFLPRVVGIGMPFYCH